MSTTNKATGAITLFKQLLEGLVTGVHRIGTDHAIEVAPIAYQAQWRNFTGVGPTQGAALDALYRQLLDAVITETLFDEAKVTKLVDHSGYSNEQ